jgi:hypothetical protein
MTEHTTPVPPPIPVQYQVTYQHPRTNHVLHLLLSLVTFGLWIPVWIIIAIAHGVSGPQQQVTGVYGTPSTTGTPALPASEHELLHPLDQRKPMSRNTKIMIGVGAVVLLIIMISAGNTPANRTTQTATVTPAPSAATAVAGTFTDGVYEVGTGDGQIAPGRYRTDAANGLSGSCSWTRLKNNDGSSDDIIAISIQAGPQFLTVKPADGYVKLSWGCTWAKG